MHAFVKGVYPPIVCCKGLALYFINSSNIFIFPIEAA